MEQGRTGVSQTSHIHILLSVSVPAGKARVNRDDFEADDISTGGKNVNRPLRRKHVSVAVWAYTPHRISAGSTEFSSTRCGWMEKNARLDRSNGPVWRVQFVKASMAVVPMFRKKAPI